MRIACGTLCFSRQPFAQSCAEIASAGFRYVDIATMEGWAHFNPSDLAVNLEDAVTVAQSVLETHRLKPVALNASAGASDPNHELPRFRAICEFALELGVSVICYAAPMEAAGLERSLRRYERLLALAQERRLTLAVEAHARTMLERPDVAARFCESLDGIALTLDPSHMWAGPNQGAPFDEIYSFVRHTHWRDSGLSWSEVQQPVGEGNVDFACVVAGLKEVRYDGAYSVEYIDTFPHGTRENIVEMKHVLERLLG
jgi:sugar phosphate isomerase/epimerase